MKEKNHHTIIRVLSWRIAATIITLILAWFVTKDVTATTFLVTGDIVLKTIGHYFHDRFFVFLHKKRKTIKAKI